MKFPKWLLKLRKKIDKYAYRIKEHIGGDFYLFILKSSWAMSPMAKKIIKQLSKAISVDSFMKMSTSKTIMVLHYGGRYRKFQTSKNQISPLQASRVQSAIL